MDNKLSELSKPVGFVSKQAQALLKSGDTASVRPFFDVQGSSPLYSQDFVAALKHKAAVNWEAAASLNVENQELKKRIAELSRLLAHNIERAEKAEKRLVSSKDAVATWERKAISNFDECATMSQRIIELEAIRSDASQVFKEIGNELGCNPDNESIMMAIDALKVRLATPVRLPKTNGYWDEQEKAFEDAITLAKRAIWRAGFKVEGDE
ncbi:hypothetical protein JY476_07320 [Serratia marcescens]|nr:hypothetical protein [Serratia marcescens]